MGYLELAQEYISIPKEDFQFPLWDTKVLEKAPAW